MAVLTLKAVNQRDFVDRPKDWLIKQPGLKEAGTIGERHMRSNLREPRRSTTHRAACRMQVSCDLVGFATCVVRRNDKRAIAGAAIERHQPVKTESEWSGPQGIGGLPDALDEDRIQIIHSCDRVDGEVERVVAKSLACPQSLPCLCHLGFDFGRRNGGKKQHIEVAGR